MVVELIRILVVSLMTGVLAFLLQPWLFQSGFIPVFDVEIEDWLAEQYMPGSAIVFASGLLAIALWYWVARRSKIRAFKDSSPMRLVWALFCLFPLIGIGVSLFFFNKSSDALLWLTSLYVLDVLLLYWFASAISSPGLLKFTPPLSFQVRNLLGLK